MAKILIVDDRAVNRQFLLTLLGYAGHDLLDAGDGAEALEIVRSQRPDLVITDILMPTMDGLQFVQQLRKDPAVAQTRVIFYTATYRIQNANALAKACGVSLVLPKPSNPETILKAVIEALRLPPASPPLKREPLGLDPVSELSSRLTEYLGDLRSPDGSAQISDALSRLHSVTLRLSELLEVSLDMTHQRDPRSLLQTFCRGAHHVLSCKYVVLALMSDDHQEIVTLIFHGLDPKTQKALLGTLPFRTALLGRLLRECRPFRSRNESGDPTVLGLPASHPAVHSLLGVPISSLGGIRGWLYVVDKLGAEEFDEDDERLAMSLAAQVAAAYENVTLYDDLQRAEDLLRKSEETYRLLFESNPRPMWVYDLETLSFLAVNNAAVSHYGYSREEFLSMTIKDIRPSEDLPDLERNIAKNTKPFTRSGIWRHRKKDGTVICTEITSHSLTFNGKAAKLVLAYDVTSTVEMEQALQESEEKYRVIAETASDAIFMIDKNSTIHFVNKSVERIFGHKVEEMLGKSMTMIIPERLRQRHNSSLEKFVSTGEKHINWSGVELPGLHKSGREIPVEISFGQIAEDGTRFFVGIVRDVTERKKAEEELKRLNEELEERVRKRTAELEAALKELEAFSYSVSHDLRAPLRSIDGFSQALLEDYAGTIDDAGKNHLNRVRAASQRMAQLIDDLLNLSRVSRAQMEDEVVNLSELAENIARELQRSSLDRRVVFTIAPGLAVRGDKRLLEIALENLLNNAWKFTGKQDDARVEFGSAEQKGETAYFVRDNGVGFDMAYVDKLFSPFQRLHAAGEFPGTGIGLATVQRIIRRHGGEIWAEGRVGEGATFYFTL